VLNIEDSCAAKYFCGNHSKEHSRQTTQPQNSIKGAQANPEKSNA